MLTKIEDFLREADFCNTDRRLAIVGSREFPFLQAVKTALSVAPEGTEVISGGAKGADRAGEVAAIALGMKYRRYLPDWDKYGKGAGFIRNLQIVHNCDAVIAFWDGKSKGTEHTIGLAVREDRPFLVVTVEDAIRILEGA